MITKKIAFDISKNSLAEINFNTFPRDKYL